MKKQFIQLLVPFTFLATPDDGWIGTRGGSVFPILRNTSISMVKEEIYITLGHDSCRVICKFWFKNENNAPQPNIYMGFPDDYNNEFSPAGNERISHFTCKVHSKRVAVKREKQREDDTTSMYYPAWYCWHVNFKPNETLLIENSYTGMIGGYSDGSAVFGYIIGTANTWHNPIGKGKVVFNYAKIASDYIEENEEFHKDEKGMTRSTYKDSTVFQFNNYTPSLREELEVTFRPKEVKEH